MKKSILKITAVLFSLILLQSCGNSQPSKSIKGLLPADVYLNFENQGFKITKNLGGEYGNNWNCDLVQDEITFKVQAYSSEGVTSVDVINASAIINVNNTIESVKDFIKFTASLPYDSAEPEKAVQWVEDNFNTDGASIIIGDAEFKISAPTEMMRQLNISKKIL